VYGSRVVGDQHDYIYHTDFLVSIGRWFSKACYYSIFSVCYTPFVRSSDTNDTTKNTKWDLSVLVGDDSAEEVEKELSLVGRKVGKFVKKWSGRKDHLKSPKVLKEALDEYESLWTSVGVSGNVGYYLGLKSALDLADTDLKARLNKIIDFEVKLLNDLEFFTNRIAKIPEKEQGKFLRSSLLEEYKHFLETLFSNAKYFLSEEVEKVLMLKHKTSRGNWIRMVSEFISKEEREVLTESGKKEKKTLEELAGLLKSKNKKVRDGTAKAINDILQSHADVAEHELNSVLEDKKVNDELRGLARPDLSRHLADDIDSEVVDALVESVSSRFDISKRFYKLKVKLLGLEKLGYHERNLSYGEIDKKYSYKESVELVSGVLGNLDEEFRSIFSKLLENGQVDVYPKKGKQGGAFCTHNLLVHPTFILLNHTDKFSDVTTLAHEMGHAINNELMRKEQNSLNFGTPTSTAEVASTFFEDFVLDELEEGADDEMRLSILMERLNDSISSITRQVSCYLFEQDIHREFREKGYLPKEEVGRLFRKRMQDYMGKYVSQDEGSENWWIHWGHIRQNFYVYSYASGLLISKFLQGMVREDSKNVGKVKEVLRAGCSDSPKNIFAKAGVDISKREFWDEGLKEIDATLREAEKLAKRLGKV
jgi:oligoendopeptidase F